jgi:hypothetical protein
MTLPADFDTNRWAHENGAIGARVVGDELVAVVPMTFGKFRLTIGPDSMWIEHGY